MHYRCYLLSRFPLTALSSWSLPFVEDANRSFVQHDQPHFDARARNQRSALGDPGRKRLVVDVDCCVGREKSLSLSAHVRIIASKEQSLVWHLVRDVRPTLFGYRG